MKIRISLFLIISIFITSCSGWIIEGMVRKMLGGLGIRGVLLTLFLLFLYFLPSFVALRTAHKNEILIVLANILFGWTGIGWLLVLIWASVGDKKSGSENLDGKYNSKQMVTPPPAEELKKCPLCAETIKLEALKCRFCGEEFRQDDFEIELKELKKQRIQEHVARIIEDRKDELKCLYCGTQLPKLSPSAYCSEEHCELFLHGSGKIVIDIDQ